MKGVDRMARKLIKKQERAIEQYYNKTGSILIDKQTSEQIANMSWYETVYQDIDRYIWDYQSKIRYFEKK